MSLRKLPELRLVLGVCEGFIWGVSKGLVRELGGLSGELVGCL